MLGVDERGDPAIALSLRDDVEADGGLPRALRPEHLDDPSARHAAHAERDVEGHGPRGDDHEPLPGRMLAELHDRPLAVLLLDLREGDVEHLLPVHVSLLPPEGADPLGHRAARDPDRRHATARV